MPCGGPAAPRPRRWLPMLLAQGKQRWRLGQQRQQRQGRYLPQHSSNNRGLRESMCLLRRLRSQRQLRGLQLSRRRLQPPSHLCRDPVKHSCPASRPTACWRQHSPAAGGCSLFLFFWLSWRGCLQLAGADPLIPVALPLAAPLPAVTDVAAPVQPARHAALTRVGLPLPLAGPRPPSRCCTGGSSGAPCCSRQTSAATASLRSPIPSHGGIVNSSSWQRGSLTRTARTAGEGLTSGAAWVPTPQAAVPSALPACSRATGLPCWLAWQVAPTCGSCELLFLWLGTLQAGCVPHLGRSRLPGQCGALPSQAARAVRHAGDAAVHVRGSRAVSEGPLLWCLR